MYLFIFCMIIKVIYLGDDVEVIDQQIKKIKKKR